MGVRSFVRESGSRLRQRLPLSSVWSRKRARSEGRPEVSAAMARTKFFEINMGYRRFVRVCNRLTNLFPLWVVTAVTLALLHPPAVTWLGGDAITFCVGATMVFTGMTLTVEDFTKILQRPSQVAMGFLCQYTIMPFFGFWITRLLALQPDVAAGVILVACCPGGTSSNLVTLIAKGDVALSVLMTTASTAVAAAVTPALVSYLAGNLVTLDAWGLVLSTLQVVMLPVGMGLVINRYFPSISRVAQTITPLLSVFIVAMICGSIIGQTSTAVLAAGPLVAVAVTLLHGGGFVFGWVVPKLLGYSERVARTTSVETGIQSSALAVVLATRHFPNPIMSSLPGALSGTVQSIMGSIMATAWHYSSIEEETDAILSMDDPLDDMLSAEQLEAMWEKYDSNGNGVLEKRELRDLLVGCYQQQIEAIKASTSTWDSRMIKALGARASGKLSALVHRSSWLSIKACEYEIRLLTERDVELDDIFRQFDVNSDGKITKKVYQSLAPKILRDTFVPAYMKQVS